MGKSLFSSNLNKASLPSSKLAIIFQTEFSHFLSAPLVEFSGTCLKSSVSLFLMEFCKLWSHQNILWAFPDLDVRNAAQFLVKIQILVIVGTARHGMAEGNEYVYLSIICNRLIVCPMGNFIGLLLSSCRHFWRWVTKPKVYQSVEKNCTNSDKHKLKGFYEFENGLFVWRSKVLL